MPRTVLIAGSSSVLALLTALLMAFAGCGRPTKAARPAPGVPVVAEFVDESSCAGCHASETDRHRASRHAITMRAMDRMSLGPLAPPTGRIPGSQIILGQAKGRYEITLADDRSESLPLALALGSGKTGMTFVAHNRPGQLLEMRESYFPHTHKWYLTPGHDPRRNKDAGLVYTERTSRKCMGCHSVTVPTNSVQPEPRFYGVGCQACHGPASAHLAAMQSGAGGDIRIERIGTWNATRVNELCGKCHRTKKDIQMDTNEVTMTQRFQPYGLMESRCFQESNDALSCLTCHDPHSNASTDHKAYEASCLKCHGGASSVAAGGKPCPVNPRSGCIPCHMATRPVFAGSIIKTSMADHRIAIFPDTGKIAGSQ